MNTSIHAVSPEYFSTMGIPFRSGRNFTGRENAVTTPKPIIVNETFMRRFGSERVVLGAMFGSVRVNGAPALPLFQVIGIVGDAKYRSVREPFQPIVYQLPIPGDSFIVHLRTRSAPEPVVAPMRGILSEIDPRLSWIEVNTLESEVAASLWPERAAAFLATLFSASAAMIVAVGLYALVAFSVIQRHREIGIRMALGAQPRNVIRLMFSTGSIARHHWRRHWLRSGSRCGNPAYDDPL